MKTDNLALLKLMYLVSPALPIGAYAYSQGQEWAVDAEWIKGQEQLTDWWQGLMHNNLACCDLPILVRCYQAWQDNDIERVQYWNDFLIASRETRELLLEDNQLAIAMVRILDGHGFERHKQLQGKLSFISLFALAAQQWHIGLNESLQGWLWSWLEKQVAAACKGVPLGQSQAQQILMQLLPEIPQAIEHALHIADEDIGAGLPGLAMASCLHERQYSRLFRS